MPRSWSEPRRAERADFLACRAMIRTGSRSFFAASKLLPPSVRWPAFALYAFCRLSDDAVDDAPAARRADVVDDLRRRFEAVRLGGPGDHPADRALAAVMRTRRLPPALFEALFEGFDWDIEGRRYEDLDALAGYAARVAGAVGALMAALMNERRPEMLARAVDLGLAMQYTNIARDVGEDARAGRIYLPLSWLRADGLDVEAWLADPAPHPAIRAATARLLDEADRLYARADSGVAGLPARCRPAIGAARRIYAAIGDEVRQNGCDSVTTRAATSMRRKLALLARAAAEAARPMRLDPSPPETSAAFLVAAAAERPMDRGEVLEWWRVDARIGRMLELFEAQKRREEAARRML